MCFAVWSVWSLFGEFSSRTTPSEAAWWEHCLWLSLSLSLSLIIFIILAFSHIPSCISRSLVSTLSSPSVFVSAAFFAQSIAAVQASHRGTRQSFHPYFCLCSSLLFHHSSPLALLLLFSSLFLPPIFIPVHISTLPLSSTRVSPTVSPHPDGCSCSKQQNAFPADIIFTKHTVGQNSGGGGEENGAGLLR